MQAVNVGVTSPSTLERLRERDEIINEMRRELQATCRDLAEDVRRELQTQLTRIAQIQQELDAVKRRP